MKTNYDNLSFLPTIVAYAVATTPYDAKELSSGNRDPNEIIRIDALRKKMTESQINEFFNLCDSKCRNAYDVKADWFMKIVKAKGNKGRDMLYSFCSHWLVAYLNDPVKFKNSCGVKE